MLGVLALIFLVISCWSVNSLEKKKALVSRMLKVFEYQANDNNHGTEIWRKFPLHTPEYSAQVISLPVSLSFRC